MLRRILGASGKLKDCTDQLNRWLSSKAREQMLEAGRNIFKAYKYKFDGIA